MHVGPTRQFPIPSYASERFWSETAYWYDAVASVLKSRIFPRGPVIAIQADNETSYCFRWETFDLDYAEDSIRLYRQFLRGRHKDVAALNRLYGTSFASFDAVEPPRRFDGSRKGSLLAALDWAAYKEWQILQAVQRSARMLKERSLSGIPFTHNFPWSPCKPFDLGEAENLFEIEIAGLDFYLNRSRADRIARRTRTLSAMSCLPTAPEFGCGAWHSRSEALLPDDLSTGALVAFMHGLKGVNFYMIAERDRWVGGALRRDGKPRPGYHEFFRRFHAVLSATDLLRHDRELEVVILRGRDSDRLRSAASDVRGEPLVLPAAAYRIHASFGNAGSTERFESLFDGAATALEEAGIDHDLGDTGIHAGALKRYRVAIVVTLEALSGPDRERLEAFAKEGGRVVFLPGPPTLDEYLRPRRMAIPSAAWSAVQNPRSLPDVLRRIGIKPVLDLAGKGVLATSFRRGGSRILFLANVGARECPAEFSLPAHPRLRDAWRGDRFEAGPEGCYRIPMPPSSIRMLVPERLGVAP